jgi:hypothetical protein
MLATIEDIRQVRPVARNITTDRVNTYIMEVEQLQVAPAIGVGLYEHIDSGSSALSEEQLTLLMNGGYYDAPDGSRAQCGGLKNAIAYLAYVRIIQNNQLNVTAFGDTVKKSEFSEPSEEGQVIYAANQARKVGQAHLNSCVDYVRAIGVARAKKTRTTTFRAIGQ